MYRSNEYSILSQDSVTVKKILVGIDGSKTSLEAADQAFFAEKHKANLTASYVVPSNVRYCYLEDDETPLRSGPLKEIVMMAVERGQKHLDEVKQKAFKNNIDIKTDVIIGKTSVVKSIVEYAEEVPEVTQ